LEECLKKFEVDKSNPTPLYFQIKEKIGNLISSGSLKPGDLLLTETQLMDQLNVSRTTVRQAYKELKIDGLISSERGKGTFVAQKAVVIETSSLVGFTREIENMGYRAGIKSSVSEITKCNEQIAKELQLSLDQSILKVTRIRTADDIILGLAISCLNTVKYPSLLDFDYSKESIYDVIQKKLGLKISWASLVIISEIATEELAKKLMINKGSAILKLCRTTYVDENIPIDYAETLLIGKIYKYQSKIINPL
jgi:GntR family transcriptional regulator